MTHCVTLALSLHLSGAIFTGNSDSHFGDTTQQLTQASGRVARGQSAGYESFPRGLDSQGQTVGSQLAHRFTKTADRSSPGDFALGQMGHSMASVCQMAWLA